MNNLKFLSGISAGIIICLVILVTDPFCYFFQMMMNWQDEPGMTGTLLETALEPDTATLSTVLTEDALATWGEPPIGYAALITETLTDIQSTWFPGITSTLTETLSVGTPYSNTGVTGDWGPNGLAVPIYLIWPGPPPEAYGLTTGDLLIVACAGMEVIDNQGTPEPIFNGEFVPADYIDPARTPDLTNPVCPSGISPTPTPSPTPIPTATPNYGCCERDLIPPDPITGNDEECFNYHGGSCPGGWDQNAGESCQSNGDCD